MPAEVTSLAQVSGVELLRVPNSPAADFQTALPSNVLRFPSEIDPTEYRRFEFPNGEILPLIGIKAEYLSLLLNTTPDNPLLDEVGRHALKKPGEEITKAKLHKRLLNARWGLRETFKAYRMGYEIAECLHETAPNEFKRATFLRKCDEFSEDTSLTEPSPEEGETTAPLPTDLSDADSPSQTPSVESQNNAQLSVPLHEQLRILAEAGVYTYSEIIGLLYPGVPIAIARNRLQAPLSRLRGKLFNEGRYISDGRKVKDGVVTVKTIGEEKGPKTSDRQEPEPVEEPKVDGEDTSLTESTTPIGQLPEESESIEPTTPPDEDKPVEIVDRTQKRAEARTSSKPKLTLTQHPDFPGIVGARIEVPGKGKTPILALSRDEALLFDTIFTSPQSYTHPDLELKMVHVALSAAFDARGGFERVFNSLNKKLAKWRISIAFNEDRQLVLSNATNTPLMLNPNFRDYDSDIENSGVGERQRRRQPSHGKLKL